MSYYSVMSDAAIKIEFPIWLSPGERQSLSGFIAWASTRTDVTQVWLFGSRACGSGHAGSDLDVAVVTDAPLNQPLRRALLDEISVNAFDAGANAGLPHIEALLSAPVEAVDSFLHVVRKNALCLWARHL